MRGRAIWLGLALAALGCDDGATADPAEDGRAPDGATQDGGPADGGSDQAVDAEPDATPDQAVDAAVPQRRVRFDPAGEGFFDTPWPSDARLTEAGTPDLTGFPGDRASFVAVRAEIERAVHGFATMPVVFVRFDDPIGDAVLPAPATSVADNSPVQLMALGERCGERVPVEISVRAEANRFIQADTLQVKNTVGTVLEPGQPYALVVTTGFGRETGPPATPSAAFQAAWAGDGSRVAASLEPLRACWALLGRDNAEVAVATVFTPHDPVAELRLLRDAAMDPALPTRAPLAFGRDGAWSRRRLNIETWSGLVEMPMFQDGETPYTSAGGAFVFDAQGQPVVQRWEPVPFMLAWRPDLEGAPAERPVLVFQDGTGWDRWSHLRGGFMGEILDQGFVIASFMPQFHGGRAGFEGDPELPSFNFLNPPAGRSNFRQQAAENSFFSRVIREQLAGTEGVPALATERLVYGGHSQGALAGALTAAVESSYAGYVFNGLSSYLTLTILERDDIIDFELLIRGLVGADQPLDLFSPALQLMQLGSEAVDPHNFARLWRGDVHNPAGNHVFVTNGFADDTTTPRGMDHLTLSAKLPVFDAPGWDIDPLGVGRPEAVRPPVQGNAVALDGRPLTLATYLDPVQGHGTIYRVAALREMALGFWREALAGGVPTLQAGSELMCGDAEDGDGDGQVDCADADCAAREPCVETRCGDGADGDGDGLVDCADEDCAGACDESACGNGEDDDGDGLTDCDDPGCGDREPCMEILCQDRQDGDGDGLVDCADPDCQGTRACRETSCSDGADNDRDGLVDCADDECVGSLACPEPACDDGLDNDGSGFADCDDPRCYGQAVCARPAETLCDDGEDDDGDGRVDCADPDCALACAAETCAAGDLGTATGMAVYQGTLEGAEDTYPPGDCTPLGAGEEAPDLPLRWQAPADGTYLISTLGSEADTVLTLYRDDCAGVEFACHDDQPGVTTSAIRLEIRADQAVVIVVSGYGKREAKPVVLHILPEPPPAP